jgi:catalase (peroxidase I)
MSRIILTNVICVSQNASGYWGPWTNAETTFSNEYFRLLLEEKWSPKKTHKGKVSLHVVSVCLKLYAFALASTCI